MNATLDPSFLSWFAIVRLGLVQTAIGSIVVLTTSTLNRVMVVELALPAMLPGALVAWHYAVQMLRPRWGFGSDVGGRRTPWIVGGMAVLAMGGLKAAAATALMEQNLALGVGLAIFAFLMIGIGVGAAGTTLLALLARRVAPGRKPAAAAIVWMMMILGMALTATGAGHLLDPFSSPRLIAVVALVAACAFLLTLLALSGIERGAPRGASPDAPSAAPRQPFAAAVAGVWAEPQTRQFTIFVFVAMFAFNMQDLILEPFAGEAFDYSPGESTRLAGIQHGGVFLGMVLMAAAGSLFKGPLGSLRAWTIAGCAASAAALGGLAIAGFAGPAYPLKLSVFALGLSNGAFAVAAIGSMMALASSGAEGREGTRMGLWGAAQAIAFGLGGFMGAASADAMRAITGSPVGGYASVFMAEAALFCLAAFLAYRIGVSREARISVKLAASESFAPGR